MQNGAQLLKTVAVGGALIWGVWSLVPVAIGVLAAILVVVYYGVSAFSLPTWALALGASAAVLTLGIASILRMDAKTELLKKVWTVGKVAGVLFIGVGALTAVATNLPPMDLGPSKVAEIDGNLRGVAPGLTAFAAWVALVVCPIGLATLALWQLWSVRNKPR